METSHHGLQRSISPSSYSVISCVKSWTQQKMWTFGLVWGKVYRTSWCFPCFSYEIWGVPVIFPIHQSSDWMVVSVEISAAAPLHTFWFNTVPGGNGRYVSEEPHPFKGRLGKKQYQVLSLVLPHATLSVATTRNPLEKPLGGYGSEWKQYMIDVNLKPSLVSTGSQNAIFNWLRW